MKNVFSSKLIREPSGLIKIALIYVACFVLSASLAFGVCYAYFTDKATLTGSVGAGTLSINYVNDSSNGADLALYISRDNYLNDSGAVEDNYEKLIELYDENGTTTNRGYYTYCMPGDKMIIKGKVENDGELSSYVLLKVSVEIVGETDADKITTHTWFNLNGEEVTSSNSKLATALNSTATVDLADKGIAYILPTDLDNSYAQQTVTITLTLKGIQSEELTAQQATTNLLAE